MKNPSDYNRLPGTSSSSLGFGRSSLWLGEDHVLLLQRRGYVEDYKRFYFKDIHAVVMRKTATFFVINIIFGVFLLSCLLLHYLGLVVWEWDGIGHSILGVWTLLFLIVLAINALRGPTCSTSLHTAVHSESITSMSRIRSSLRAMSILRRKIEEIQGHLSEEILIQHPGIHVPPVLIPPPVKEGVKNVVVSDYKGNAHLALFSFLLVDAILTAVSIFNRTNALLIIGTICSAVLWLLIMISLVKQRHGDLPRTVTGLTWGVLIYGAIYYAFSYFFFMVIAMQDPSMGTNQWEWMKKIWEISPLDHPALLFLSIFSITCSLVLGIPGVIAMLRLRTRGRIKQEQAIAGGDAS